MVRPQWMHLIRSSSYLVPVLGASIAFAVFPAEDTTHCSLITNNDLRLLCYDSLFLKSQEKVRVETPETVQQPPNDSLQPQIEMEVMQPIKVTVVKEEADTIVQQQNTVENQDIGKEQLKPKRSKRKTESITARVVKVSARPRGELIVELENGQVWVQSSVRWFKVKPGDRVSITKYRLGGYSLRTEGGASTRVRRVN